MSKFITCSAVFAILIGLMCLLTPRRRCSAPAEQPQQQQLAPKRCRSAEVHCCRAPPVRSYVSF
ncbi:MAG: hypothetical protein ACKVI4_16295 [Actinomycetales bacterium]